MVVVVVVVVALVALVALVVVLVEIRVTLLKLQYTKELGLVVVGADAFDVEHRLTWGLSSSGSSSVG